MVENDGTCVSGVNVLGQRAALEQLVGEEAFKAALDKLPASFRATYDTVTPLSWVPIPILETMLLTVAEHTGRDPQSLQAESVRMSVERTLRTVWRVLLRFTSDDALVSRTPVFYNKTFNRGALATKIVTPGCAEIVLTGWPEVPSLQLLALGVGIEGVLYAAGRRELRSSCERTADGARYTVSWRV